MALASSSDVELALGRDLTEDEDVSTLLESASDLVAAHLGVTPDPVPPAVVRVVADMVAACLTKPAVSTSDYQAGGYNTQREVATVHVGTESATTNGPWLTKSLRARLSPYRIKRAFSINTAVNSAAPVPNSVEGLYE